jgi:hypothetical protein
MRALPPELPRDLVRGFALDAVSFQPRDEAISIAIAIMSPGSSG